MRMNGAGLYSTIAHQFPANFKLFTDRYEVCTIRHVKQKYRGSGSGFFAVKPVPSYHFRNFRRKARDRILVCPNALAV